MASLCHCLFTTGWAQVTLNLDAGQRGPEIGNRHYGIFFEEINHAGDGGLYAELVQNRSFEDNGTNPDKWWAIGKAEIQLITEDLLNDKQEHALEVVFKENGDGVRNEGFWGINVVSGETYQLTFWVKTKTSFNGRLTAELQNADQKSLGSTEISTTVGKEWTKVTAEITATENDPNGWLALKGSASGSICLDVVSLFPPTYKDRPNGCRKDLAQMLETMKPAFVRFPGGCYVEGAFANEKTNRFEWKNTIGPIEERPGHRNQNWGYNISDGFGFHEMLQLTEDLGAEPLFVVNMGMGHGWVIDYRQIDEYIQEALDAIEYCNGDAKTTKWGALRAANGHPEPFNLRLLEIGNENYNFNSGNNSDQSDHYAERYDQFYRAIKAQYPEITLIGNVESWGTDNPSWRNPYPVEVVDEHYYRSPGWFVNQYEKYNTYSRSSYKVYAGEYAVTQNFGVNGHLNAALGEAVYMLGMENNSDVCIMNSYAPIFVNENHVNPWRPDMIRFNSSTCFGTPSYYVQQLLPNNLGKQNVKWTEENNLKDGTCGKIGLSTWKTQATFDNVKLTDGNNQVIFSDDFSTQQPQWYSTGGTWSTQEGVLTQTDQNMQGKVYVCQVDNTADYTLELNATKNQGDEGFLIAFNYEDENNFCWWNLGGWGNTKHAIEQSMGGSKTTLAETSGTLVNGHTYHIKIEVKGTHVKCYLDQQLIHETTIPSSRKIYVASNINDEEGIMYVKIVNPYGTAQPTTINLKHATIQNGTVVVLSSESGLDENTMEQPANVTPKEAELNVSGNQFIYEVPAYSLNILRLNVSNVEITPEEPAELPQPAVKYSFENGKPNDDQSIYNGNLQGGATIVTMNDGNKVLYTGPSNEKGYLDLGAEAACNILKDIHGDYSVSVDILLPEIGNLNQYCWAYGITNGTDQYIGLVNTANNTDWYYTIKNQSEENVRSESGLTYNEWHNLTYIQTNNIGKIYIDGYPLGEKEVIQSPSDISTQLTQACIGKSPFADDAYLEGAFFDNFQIFNQALQEPQVKELYKNSQKQATASDEASHLKDISELNSLLRKFNFLHTTTVLPQETANGTAITWNLETIVDNYVALETTGSGVQLVVQKLAEGTQCIEAARLTAKIGNEKSLTLTQSVYVAPDDNKYGYLYCFMNANKEITNFALGTKEDKGHAFNVLLNGEEVFDTEKLAEIEHGTRDAYIQRGEESDGFFITTTDMKQHVSGVWRNHGMNLLRSKDLIHWESSTFDFNQGKKIFSDPGVTTGAYDTDEEYAKINRVWAPQFIWDKDYNHGQGAYLIYYSLLSSNQGDTYDKIYYSYTDREFKTLTQPRVFFDPGISVIDADIIYNPYDSLYHMYYKREGASGTARGIYEATSATLTGNNWKEIMHVTNEGAEQVEGSSTVRRINEDVYNLYYMRYSGGNAYKYCETDHLGLNVTSSSPLKGTGAFQHGSVMTVTEAEYVTLQNWSNVRLFLPIVEQLKEESGSNVFDNAIQQTENALALTDISQLSTALPQAYQALQDAVDAYKEEICNNLEEGKSADFTFFLVNPGFNQGEYGWTGTGFTAASAGVAEHYNKTFDTYQIIKNMPAGKYEFLCQGFYRAGSIETAYSAHQNNTEELLASLYINEQKAPFMSLYDETAPYTYRPYTYPDNVSGANSAFNNDNQYHGNSVTYELTEKGDLQVGMSKTQTINSDWTCFDNFRLLYLGKGTGIREVIQTSESPTDVYSLSGIRVKKGIKTSESLKGLPAGIYIIGKQKVVIR